MTRCSLYFALLTMFALAGCVESDEFESSCDGETSLDGQLSCLDSGFQMLTAQVPEDDVDGDGDHDEHGEDFDGDREDLEEAHREDGDHDRRLGLRKEGCERLREDRGRRGEIRDLHRRTRAGVEASRDIDSRRELIREGLRDGRDVALRHGMDREGREGREGHDSRESGEHS